MPYFADKAARAFKTTPGGERLFCPGGPWSAAYVVPDTATEQKLFAKQVWLQRISAGGRFFGTASPAGVASGVFPKKSAWVPGLPGGANDHRLFRILGA
jgi:hypothetical protein